MAAKRFTFPAVARSSLPWEESKGPVPRVLELPVRHPPPSPYSIKITN